MNNGHDSRDNQRRLPPPLDEKLLNNQWRNGGTRQEKVPRPPIRAIRIKGNQLRAAVRNGHQLDWADIHERYVDLWQEVRLVIWRAKHGKRGLPQTDPVTGETVETYVSDDKMVLQAIDTARGILDSMLKLRREMGEQPSQIPHWALTRIEHALRNHPEALRDLLKALTEGEDDTPMQ